MVLGHLSEINGGRYVIADNQLAMNAGWNEELLRGELESLGADGFDLSLVGFSDEELVVLLGSAEPEAAAAVEEEAVPEPPAQPVTMPGDVWLIGPHRLICGDCRDAAVVGKLMAGASANVAMTSPPYATQREYDPSSGFKPVPPEEYVAWFRDCGRQRRGGPGAGWILLPEHQGARRRGRAESVRDGSGASPTGGSGAGGSWMSSAGARPTTACRAVGETGSRTPGSRSSTSAASSRSSSARRRWGTSRRIASTTRPDNPKSSSGSGLLGTGARGESLGQRKDRRRGAHATQDGRRHRGIARPSNVIEVKTESSQGSHSAPFPRALVEFFVKAFSDPGDVVFDPFLGSGTTMAAAHVLGRAGYGCEISPAYCDVILRRIENLAETEPVLAETGEKFSEVAAGRGVPSSRERRSAPARLEIHSPQTQRHALLREPKASRKRSSTQTNKEKTVCPKQPLRTRANASSRPGRTSLSRTPTPLAARPTTRTSGSRTPTSSAPTMCTRIWTSRPRASR